MTTVQQIRNLIARYVWAERKLVHAGLISWKPREYHWGVIHGLCETYDSKNDIIGERGILTAITQAYAVFALLECLKLRKWPM